MLKPVKKIITDSGETRIISLISREEKAIQTDADKEPPPQPPSPSQATVATVAAVEESDDYDLHPKLQELLEYFVRDDKFTITSQSDLTSIKNDILSFKNEFTSFRNDLGEIKMILKVLKSKQNNGKYND